MEAISSENQRINTESLNILSDKGSEVVVYNDDDTVYKIFKKDYKLGHKSIEELLYLSSIKTSRTLMPKSLLFESNELVGYTMEYIKDNKNILDVRMEDIIKELNTILKDIDTLSRLNIRLMDINSENTIFNGKLYLIDPGNYYINNVKDLSFYFQNREVTNEEKQKLIAYWNHDKLNKLMYELLFMNNNDIDFYLLRKIIEFFRNEREKDGVIRDIWIYQRYFDTTLTVRESINKFIASYIKVDDEEKKMILSLLNRNSK